MWFEIIVALMLFGILVLSFLTFATVAVMHSVLKKALDNGYRF